MKYFKTLGAIGGCLVEKINVMPYAMMLLFDEHYNSILFSDNN